MVWRSVAADSAAIKEKWNGDTVDVAVASAEGAHTTRAWRGRDRAGRRRRRPLRKWGRGGGRQSTRKRDPMVQGFDVGVERGVVGEGTITGPAEEATGRRKERARELRLEKHGERAEGATRGMRGAVRRWGGTATTRAPR